MTKHIKSFNNCRVELTRSRGKVVIEFIKKDGFSTYKIVYEESSVHELLLALRCIHKDDINYPSRIVFWKDWFNPIVKYIVGVVPLLNRRSNRLIDQPIL